MKVDNPLSHEFLSQYPTEAARVLELISIDHVAAFFNEMPPAVSAPVLVAMLPTFAAGCVARMEATTAAKLLTETPVTVTTRIFRLLQPQVQEALSTLFSGKTRNRIKRILNYASLSAGDLMDPHVQMLPEDLTIADAIRRIERYRQSISCEIFVVDNSHHLKGAIELGKLLTTKHHIKLKDVMKRIKRSVSAQASSGQLLSHPGWADRQRLPVIDRDNTLVGILDYTRVKETVSPEASETGDSLESLISLTGLYWLSMVQLLTSLFIQTETNKGKPE